MVTRLGGASFTVGASQRPWVQFGAVAGAVLGVGAGTGTGVAAGVGVGAGVGLTTGTGVGAEGLLPQAAAATNASPQRTTRPAKLTLIYDLLTRGNGPGIILTTSVLSTLARLFEGGVVS